MKIGFFITARLKSSRLKQKILLDLNGKSIIDRVIERCNATHGIDGVVLCTSTNRQDSILYKKAIDHGIEFYPGSEDDVLNRLLSAAEYFGYDAFVSITADNPLFSIYITQLAIDNYKSNKPDFTFIKNLPVGLATTCIDVNALKVACFIKEMVDTEIWGPFVNRPDIFNITEIHVQNSPFKEEKRLTCDYIEDYLLIKKIYEEINSNIPDIFEVFNLLIQKPQLWEINGHHKQKSLSKKTIDEINNNINKNINKAKSYARSINKEINPNYNKIIIPL
jgi:spore coat polysaccharide biosynthesis protein SpsF